MTVSRRSPRERPRETVPGRRTPCGLLHAIVAAATMVAMLLPVQASGLTASEMSVSEFMSGVSQARAAVAGFREGENTSEAARATAVMVRDAVPSDAVVEIDGVEVAVDAGEAHDLAYALGDAPDEASRSEAAADLDALLGSLAAALGGPGAPPDDDPAVLDGVLAQLGVGGGSDFEQLVREFVQGIVDAVNDFFASLLGREASGDGARIAFYVFSGAAALGVVWLVLIVVRRWLASTAPEARRIAGTSLLDIPAHAAAEGLPDDVAGYAAAAAAEGRHREAVRALFGGAARALVSTGVVAHARTRTTAELLADVRAARSALGVPLADLAGVFEPAWYGHLDPGADGYSAARRHFDEVMRAIEGGAPS